MEFILEIVPCFDYGTTKAWIRSYKEDHYMAIGGNDGLLISTDFHCRMMDRHSVSGSCSVKQGERTHLSILYRRPEDLAEGHDLLVQSIPVVDTGLRFNALPC